MKHLDQDGLLYLWTLLKGIFVKQEAGKGLSTNDYTTVEKNKLAGIAASAQVNKIETVKVNGTALDITSKAVNVEVPTNVSQLNNDSGYTKVQKSSSNGNILIDGGEVNVYTHPTATAKSAAFVKVGTDASGHVVIGNAVAKKDITDLGIPAQDTTYGNATTSAAGLMSATDKAKLDGIASEANKYVLPNATASTLGGVKVGSNITVSSGVISINKANVTTALGYTPMTPTEVSTAIQNAGHLKRTIVETLPAVSSADANTIYMVLEDSASTNNKYVEYMVINGAWEKVGTSDVDLTPYLKTADLQRITNDEIDAILAF